MVELTRHGIDFESLPLATVENKNVSFVGRYFGENSAKVLTRREAFGYADNNIDIFSIYEDGGRDALGGRAVGERHAQTFLEQSIAAGMKGSRPCAAAIDFDAAGEGLAILEALLPYFLGWVAVVGIARVWAYGGDRTIAYLLDKGVVSGAFQTYAWSGTPTVWDSRAKVRQYLNGTLWDYDLGLGEDFGQWRAGVVPPAPVPPLAYLLPVEKGECQKLIRLVSKHASFHPNAIHEVRAKVQIMRVAVKRAAVDGKTLTGATTPKGWDIRNRQQRYDELSNVLAKEK